MTGRKSSKLLPLFAIILSAVCQKAVFLMLRMGLIIHIIVVGASVLVLNRIPVQYEAIYTILLVALLLVKVFISRKVSLGYLLPRL